MRWFFVSFIFHQIGKQKIIRWYQFQEKQIRFFLKRWYAILYVYIESRKLICANDWHMLHIGVFQAQWHMRKMHNQKHAMYWYIIKKGFLVLTDVLLGLLYKGITPLNVLKKHISSSLWKCLKVVQDILKDIYPSVIQ